MIKKETCKYITSTLLVLSTLLLPLQFFGIALYFIPSIYIGLIVPYLLGRIWFDNTNRQADIASLLWKIPLIIFLAIALFYVELGLVFAVPTTLTFIWKTIIFVLLVLLVRCVTYAMMVFVWQSGVLTRYRKVIYIVIIAYCAAVAYLMYSIAGAADTDTIGELF